MQPGARLGLGAEYPRWVRRAVVHEGYLCKMPFQERPGHYGDRCSHLAYLRRRGVTLCRVLHISNPSAGQQYRSLASRAQFLVPDVGMLYRRQRKPVTRGIVEMDNTVRVERHQRQRDLRGGWNARRWCSGCSIDLTTSHLGSPAVFGQSLMKTSYQNWTARRPAHGCRCGSLWLITTDTGSGTSIFLRADCGHASCCHRNSPALAGYDDPRGRPETPTKNARRPASSQTWVSSSGGASSSWLKQRCASVRAES